MSEKQGLLTHGQPPVYSQGAGQGQGPPGSGYQQQPQGQGHQGQLPPGATYAPAISMQPAGTTSITDEYFVSKLNAISNFELRQGNVVGELLTSGVWSNVYLISDADRPTPVVGHAKQVSVGTPVFMVREESGCCCRACCYGHHPLLAKVYHAQEQVMAGKTCCGIYSGHSFQPDLTRPPAMTMERPGCCQKWLGCLICCEFCGEDAFFHNGDFVGKPGQTKPNKETGDFNAFGRSKNPKWGGCMTPTLVLHTQKSKDMPFAWIMGPSCYGGCKGLCCDESYFISSTNKKYGDYGVITKKKPRSCGECCAALCTDVDNYTLETQPKFMSLDPVSKATILGSVIHLDYFLFETDRPPIMLEMLDRGGCTTTCTLCQIYCCGCCCPVQLCCTVTKSNS